MMQSHFPTTTIHLSLCLDSVVSLRKVRCALLGLLQRSCAVLCRESSSDGASLFWSEIEREVLLVLVEEAELRALVGVDDCENLGYTLSEVVAIKMLVSILRMSRAS
jgi:hypothetical protein